MARGKLEPGMRPWKPGQSGNPSGKPKDLAGQIARFVFSVGLKDKSAAMKLWRKALSNPKMFQVLSDRAFGKLKIPVEADMKFAGVSDEELTAKLDALMEQLKQQK